jgi:UDP-glucose 4-epimerase
MLNDKIIAVTGGTGSFGGAFVDRVLQDYKPKKIIIISRDEEKQHRMRLKYNNPILEFQIADTRNRDRMFEVFKGVDYCFHAAAMKQVPSCEFFPMEAVLTNIHGVNNVLDACIYHKVKKIIVLSTDKAVYPINAMGISKAMMEKIAIAKSRDSGDTCICLTRYGNVMMSRGSVIPIWIQNAKEKKPLMLTGPWMTRFLLSLPDAINLVLHALKCGKNGELFVMKAPACRMETLSKAVNNIFGSTVEDQVIGIRHGEKMHETLVGEEEMMRALDEGNYYRIIPDGRDINYEQYFSQSAESHRDDEAFTSLNTKRLNTDEVETLLLGLKEVQDELREKT